MTIQIKLLINKSKDENKEKQIKEEEDDYILLKNIEQTDFISFLGQENINSDKINEIKNNIILKHNDKNNVEDKLLSQKEICSLTIFLLYPNQIAIFANAYFVVIVNVEIIIE